jgi:hypothetical protein
MHHSTLHRQNPTIAIQGRLVVWPQDKAFDKILMSISCLMGPPHRTNHVPHPIGSHRPQTVPFRWTLARPPSQVSKTPALASREATMLPLPKISFMVSGNTLFTYCSSRVSSLSLPYSRKLEPAWAMETLVSPHNCSATPRPVRKSTRGNHMCAGESNLQSERLVARITNPGDSLWTRIFACSCIAARWSEGTVGAPV